MQGRLSTFYFWVLFIYNAASTSLLTVTDWAPWYFSCIPLLLSVYVARKYKVNLFDSKLIILVGVLLVWNAAQYIFNHVTPSPYALMIAIIAWVAYNVFHDNFAERFVRVTVRLSAISLIVWGIGVLIPDVVNEFGKKFGIETMNVSYSFIFFNISKSINYRNCGCCWEPGRFSCILVIALYFYYERYGLRNKTKEFYILIASLFTTMSTTGFIALFVLVFYILFKKKRLNPLYWIPIIAVSAYIWSMPFMSEKIENLSSNSEFENSLEIREWLVKNGKTENLYCPQRFEGMAFQWMNIQHMNPVFGDGHNYTKFYINKVLDYNIVVSEGILFQILCYGLILGLISYYYLFKSSKYWGKRYANNDIWLFFILFIVTNFSYNFWEFPLYSTMWLWGYFEYTKNTLIKYKL